MKMNKMFAGLIAFVAGVALSAGSAFATKGYIGGAPDRMKLVPYYETGDSRATIIGIQNMSPREASTMGRHQAVSDAMAALADNTADTSLDTVAEEEQALADAQEAIYTEHVFVGVNVFDKEGMMTGSAVLCLAENQFGYVILQGPEMQDSQMEIPGRGMILSVMDDEISEYGYVEVTAEDRKFTGCGATAPQTLMNVDTDASTADVVDVRGADSMVATWAIVQDTGMGFFGTEVQTATMSMRGLPAAVDDDNDATDPVPAMDPVLACYSGNQVLSLEAANGGTPGTIGNRTGDFMMTRCGLIPERHDNSRDADGDPQIADGTNTIDQTADEAAKVTARAAASAATPRAHAFARYDAGDESMVYVWLATGMDTDDTTPSERRMLEVVVRCEGGEAIMDADIDGNPGPIMVPAPDMVTMIDPNGDALGDFTAMCEGDRGVLQITMPDGSTAGSVFSHVTQMMGHYRMNFPAYSMANPVSCFEMTAAAGDRNQNGSIDTGETGVDLDGNGTGGEAADLTLAREMACM